MRAFIVLCFVAAAYADQLGYDYQPVGHSDAGLSFAPGSVGGGSIGGGSFGGSSFGGSSIGGGSFGGSNLGGASFGGSGLGGGSFGGSGVGGGSFGGSGLGGGSFGGSGVGGGSFGGSGVGGGSEYEKEFYSFSAPEHEFEDAGGASDIANSLKRNLQVVFIKGPENRGLENAALALAKHAADQRTAIYVLNKQTDIGDLAHKLNSVQSHRQKPEVHFVKYRTPEDAANAQHQIQSQYDQLGGSSQSHNGGVAPVLNFASPSQVHAPAPHAPSNAYLPSSIFKRRV